MEGLTMPEMAEILELDENTIKQRIWKAKIKPLTTKAVYPREALEAIRNVPGKGRPPKAKPDKKG
jgi:hypothetical protein